ncbi:MAG: type II toxin-antitoxin system VapC family toxin [Pseudomonadota bacterium]
MVIDASVATKWFLDEEGSDAAHALLEQHLSFVAPRLIKTEVAAAIAKAVRMQKIDEDLAHDAHKIWQHRLKRGVIKLEDKEEEDGSAFVLSTQLSHPLQDCLYLAVALRLSLPLITTDKKLIEKATLAEVDVKTLDDFQV